MRSRWIINLLAQISFQTHQINSSLQVCLPVRSVGPDVLVWMLDQHEINFKEFSNFPIVFHFWCIPQPHNSNISVVQRSKNKKILQGLQENLILTSGLVSKISDNNGCNQANFAVHLSECLQINLTAEAWRKLQTISNH